MNIKKCYHCKSNDLQMNQTNHIVCSRCGTIQKDLNISKYGYIENINNTKPNNFSSLGSVINYNDTQIFPKFKKLAKIQRNVELKYTNSKKYFLRCFDKIIEKNNFNFNQKMKIEILRYSIFLQTKSQEKKRRLKTIFLSAILYYFIQHKILSIREFQLKYNIEIDSLVNFLGKIGIKTNNYYDPNMIFNNLISKVFKNRSFKDRCYKNSVDIDTLRAKITKNFSNELERFPKHRQRVTNTIAKIVYNLLKRYNNRIVSYELLNKITQIPSYSIRSQKYSK